jgi:hypothetical protein
LLITDDIHSIRRQARKRRRKRRISWGADLPSA